jgi:hypothetical protein
LNASTVSVNGLIHFPAHNIRLTSAPLERTGNFGLGTTLTFQFSLYLYAIFALEKHEK